MSPPPQSPVTVTDDKEDSPDASSAAELQLSGYVRSFSDSEQQTPTPTDSVMSDDSESTDASTNELLRPTLGSLSISRHLPGRSTNQTTARKRVIAILDAALKILDDKEFDFDFDDEMNHQGEQ